jgi:TPR repeat protein
MHAVTLGAVAEARRTRLPLQIGIQSLYSLAVASATLVPAAIALLSTLFILIVAGGIIIFLLFSQGWVIALAIIGLEGMLFFRGIAHLKLAMRTRPADALFDETGLAIVGGRLHGRSIAWKDCADVREEKVGGDDVVASRAVIERKDGSKLVVAEASDESELASLRALCESVRARVHPDKLPPLPPEERPDLLRCPSCSAPAAPIDADHTTCGFCAAEVPIAASLREKLRATDEVLKSSKVTAPLLAKLLAQPNARQAMLLSLIAGIPIAATWIVAVVFSVLLYRHHALRFVNIALLSATALITIVACYYLLRFWFVNRMALGVITLSFGAFPPAKEGAPWTCRSCSGPLPPARDGLLARCTWCGSDNVQGIDVRPRAEGARKERATLENAFERREKDRRTYALRAAASLAVLPLSLWGFAHASRAVTRDAKLMVACDKGELPKCVDLGLYYLEADHYDRDKAMRTFERACKGGSSDGCGELGDLLGAGDEKDVERAVDLLWPNCQGGHGMSCTRLGLIIDAKHPTLKPGVPKPAELWRLACDAKDVRGCTVLAEVTFPKDPAEGIKLWEQACAARDSVACSDLAQLYYDGNKVTQDIPRAIAMWKTGCGTSPPTYSACAGLGHAYEKGVGVPKDPTKSWDLLRTSCEYGHVPDACTRVGEIQEAQNRLDAAFDHYASGCAGYSAGGCLGLASIYVKRHDSKHAIGVLRRACLDQHLPEACALGGIWYANGENVEADPKQAAELYAAGCALDAKDSCNLGGQLADEQKDYVAARPLLTRACELGELGACNYLGQELEEGLGGDPDTTGALAAYKKACDTPPEGDKHAAQAYGCAHEGLLARKLGDESRAQPLLRKACDWQSPSACAALSP